jgi:hypothetical protein
MRYLEILTPLQLKMFYTLDYFLNTNLALNYHWSLRMSFLMGTHCDRMISAFMKREIDSDYVNKFLLVAYDKLSISRKIKGPQ